MTREVGPPDFAVTGPPNTRVQRTRSSPSAHRSPLTRSPLGRFIGLCVVILGVSLVQPLVGEIEKSSVVTDEGIQLFWWPKIPALEGWHQDLDHSRLYGANALAPLGKTFADAETVMYAKALYKPREASKTVAELINSDRADFESTNPGIRISEVSVIATGDGKRLRSFTFFPKKNRQLGAGDLWRRGRILLGLHDQFANGGGVQGLPAELRVPNWPLSGSALTRACSGLVRRLRLLTRR